MEYKPSFVDQLDENYISHHGILGQRWGVRRFQNEDGSLTAAGKERYGTYSKSNTNTNVNDNWYPSKKELATGAAIVGTALAAYGGYKLASDLDLKSNPNYDKASGFIKQSGKHNPIDDLYNSNPLYEIPGRQYIHNCPRATIAYELRRRGYDVRATGSYYGMYTSAINNMYKNIEIHDIKPTLKNESTPNNPAVFETPAYKKAQHKRVDDIFVKCASFGPNARGNVQVRWKQGGGHIFAFENDSKGNPIFMDAQIAQGDKHNNFLFKKYNKYTKKIVPDDVPKSHGGYDSYYADILRAQISPTGLCMVRRTDNAEINFDYLHENQIVKNPSLIKRKLGIGV